MPTAIDPTISAGSSQLASGSSPSSAELLPPLPPLEDALRLTCFQSWYPRYRKVSPKATVIPIDDIQPDFLDWLEEDGLTVPHSSDDADGDADDDGFASDRSSAPDEDEDEEEAEFKVIPRRFIALDERIRQVMNKYDGRVFPKLNWSAPRDAAWILPGTNLQCMTPSDVYLLLKSSDFVMNDVAQARELLKLQLSPTATLPSGTSGHHTPLESIINGEPLCRPSLHLVLKKWFDMAASHEFRCFVRANRLIAIAQRDDNFYDHLQSRETRHKIRSKLHAFWYDHLNTERTEEQGDGQREKEGEGEETAMKPETGFALTDYVFDAYLTRDMGKVFLIDINPYLPRTDALLWDWDELEDLASGKSSSDRSTSAATPGLTGATEDREYLAESDEEEEEEDVFETVVRVYTDGSRPPAAVRVPIDPSRRLPRLRIITSHLHSQQVAGGGAPRYARNMMPRDLVDASDGQSIAELAKEWNERLGSAIKP